MPNAYVKQTWRNGVGGATPISAARLEHMEDGIDTNSTTLAGLGGATVSDQQLKDWVTGEAYELTAITRDSDEVATTATVKWPDGSAGTFTAVTKNATFLAIDAFSVSHTLSGKTVTQSAVTRDSAGAVTVKPALTVA